jgi:radical SAM protein with 4Fe4S-binding SPASM domain
MKKRIEEMAGLGVKSFVFSGEGEPLLNPEIDNFFKFSKQNNIDCALISNGIFIRDTTVKIIVENLSWVRISVNGGDSESYSIVHNVPASTFQKVLNNIKKLVDYKKKVNSNIVIGSQIIALDGNYKNIGNLAEKLKKIGVDYLTVKPYLPLYNEKINNDKYIKNVKSYISYLEKYEYLNDNQFSFKVRIHSFDKLNSRKYLRCLGNSFYCEIKSNGDLIVCGVHINNDEFKYGNLYKQSFQEIWGGDQRMRVKQYLEEKIDIQKSCMPNCRLDEVNRFLWDLKNLPEHINFI